MAMKSEIDAESLMIAGLASRVERDRSRIVILSTASVAGRMLGTDGVCSIRNHGTAKQADIVISPTNASLIFSLFGIEF